MVIWFHPFQSILVHWFLECQRSLLPSPVWLLSICLDSWTWHSRFLCNIVLYSIRLFFHHQTHPQLSTISSLAQPCYSFWSYFFALPQYHTGHLLTWGAHLSCHIFLSFHTVHGVLEARILKWFATPFSNGPCFVRTLKHDLSILDGPPSMTHSSIELYKTGIHVFILVSFLWWCFLFWRPLDWSSCFFFLPSDGWR